MNTNEISRERIERWLKKLEAANATPVILFGVGHGDNEGQLVMCLPENADNNQIATFCLHAAKALLENNPQGAGAFEYPVERPRRRPRKPKVKR